MEMAWNVKDGILGNMEGPTSVFLAGTSQMMTVIFAVMIAVGIIVCFFGLKLLRVLAALAGLLAGVSIGMALAFGIGLTGMAVPGVCLACALILAVLCAVVRRFGAFVLTLINMMGVLGALLWPRSWILAGVCAAAALLIAVMAVIKTEAVVVVITGISGGVSAGISAAALIGMNEKNWWIGYVISAVLALIGIWIQFMMQSRKIGKKEKVYSRQIREEVSRESEVERARQILDEDGEDEDDGDGDAGEDITIISEEL